MQKVAESRRLHILLCLSSAATIITILPSRTDVSLVRTVFNSVFTASIRSAAILFFN